MNGREQQELAIRLENALARAGIAVERPVTEGGNVNRYAPVPGAALMAPWAARLWRVRMVKPCEIKTIDIGRGR